ncbi:MAG: DEAD/DEAH box helicase, partial [Ramlibacter sp.]
HVFNYGLPMKAEDYTHRIGRTGRAGRDGLAVTFAEQRDRRRIFDIEAYTRQPFKSETIPGLEPQQRAPQGSFKPARDYGPRDRKFGGAPRTGGFGGGNFAPREDRGFDARRGGNEGFGGRRNEGFVQRSGQGFAAPRGGEGFAPRGGEGFAPRGDFAPRAPSFAKPARPGNGGKVFVPRDAAKKRAYKPAKP